MRSSRELRASASAKAFVKGLLNSSLDIEVDNKLCYFSEECDKYKLKAVRLQWLHETVHLLRCQKVGFL